jgi:hypothetical protein
MTSDGTGSTSDGAGTTSDGAGMTSDDAGMTSDGLPMTSFIKHSTTTTSHPELVEWVTGYKSN